MVPNRRVTYDAVNGRQTCRVRKEPAATVGTFATTLRALLDERQLSQAALARRLDISAQAVSAWLASNVVPTRENVERIEDELAVEPRGSLLEAAGYSQSNNSHAEGPTVESLLRADPGLDAEDKRVLLRILRLARERHAEAQQRLIEGLESHP